MLPRKLRLRDGVRRSAVVPTSNPLTSASKLNECERFVIAAGIMGRGLGARVKTAEVRGLVPTQVFCIRITDYSLVGKPCSSFALLHAEQHDRRDRPQCEGDPNEHRAPADLSVVQ